MTAEAGHHPNRAYMDQSGNLHLNGASLFDGSEVDQKTNLAALVTTPVAGVAASYKIARGQLTTASATDTVVTGLTTVVSAVGCYDDSPGDANTFVSCTIGDQAGTPAAGSIIVKTWKTADGADVTPVAATSFSKKVNWIAIGT